jgi:hypothetical protein
MGLEDLAAKVAIDSLLHIPVGTLLDSAGNVQETMMDAHEQGASDSEVIKKGLQVAIEDTVKSTVLKQGVGAAVHSYPQIKENYPQIERIVSDVLRMYPDLKDPKTLELLADIALTMIEQ